MADAGLPARAPRARAGWAGWRNRLARSPSFQSWASRMPFLRGIARREGEALFELVSGFVRSQILTALVELDVLERALERPIRPEALPIPADRAEVLLCAAVSLKLMEREGEAFRTSRRGAALLGVPGLAGMIAHHDVLYRDLADPVAFFRGETETELAGFWPYVFGPGAADDPDQAARYSRLMSDSQALVAEEVLRHVSFAGVRRLLDVGGGSGAFAAACAGAVPGLEVRVFDLPRVVPAATERFARLGLSGRAGVVPGDFRRDALPAGSDAVSLVRVLYDHPDETVRALLASVRDALPPGGRIVVAEPMRGDPMPDGPGDVYFAVYCMAMRSGRARRPSEIANLLKEAGFSQVRPRRTHRPFVTGIVEAVA